MRTDEAKTKAEWVSHQVAEQVRQGELAPGEQLPPETELAVLYGVSRITVRAALARLARRGYVSRQRGRGTFILDPMAGRRISGVRTLIVALRAIEASPGLVAVPHFPAANYFVEKVVKGFARGLRGTAHALRYLHVDPGQELAGALAGVLGDEPGTCGVFSVQPRVEDAAVRLCRDSRAPLVRIGPHDGREAVSSVDIDNASGMYRAASRLLQLGRRRILQVVPAAEGGDWVWADRLRGLERAYHEAGLKLPRNLILAYRFSESGSDVIENVLARRDDIDAIMVHGQWMAVALANSLREAGVRIPAEVSLLVYGGEEIARDLIFPAPTVVSQPIEDMGVAAAEILLQHIAQPQTGMISRMLQPALIVRDSCDPRLAAQVGPAGRGSTAGRRERPP